MSDKTNRISVRSVSGPKVEDMKDYIKLSMKCKPDNLILHMGTNNLRTNDALAIAEEVVNLCESIERESPQTKLAISQLTVRQDSAELEQKRISVNKSLCSFVKSREWRIISHDNIDTTCLNERKVHLNFAGQLAKQKILKIIYPTFFDRLKEGVMQFQIL